MFTVGICPVKDSAFNRSKSWLKMMECAATGVPCVVSDHPEYALLHAEGVGLVARKPKDWFRHLRDLMGSRDMRDELSGRGREVAARWTVEDNAYRWWEAWELAHKGHSAYTGVRHSHSPT